jgi:adenosine deaminase
LPAAPDLLARLRSLPKAEIHVHLEGSLELPGDWRPQVGAPLRQLLEALTAWCSELRTREDVAAAAHGFAFREARSGVGWADVIVNPEHWPAFDARLGDLVAGLDEGFAAAEAEGATPAGLCVSLSRSLDAAAAEALAAQVVALAHPRVVALSVDGDEAAAGRSGPRLAGAFAIARGAGLRTTAHAGESSGPEGVRDALDLLRAERIDHGVRALDEPELVARLTRERVALGICPTSNVVLGLVASIADHPIEALRRAGVPVSVNTDDPGVLGIALEDEYAACVEAFGWDDDVLRAVARTSIEASFAPPDVRDELLEQLAAW